MGRIFRLIFLEFSSFMSLQVWHFTQFFRPCLGREQSKLSVMLLLQLRPANITIKDRHMAIQWSLIRGEQLLLSVQKLSV